MSLPFPNPGRAPNSVRQGRALRAVAQTLPYNPNDYIRQSRAISTLSPATILGKETIAHGPYVATIPIIPVPPQQGGCPDWSAIIWDDPTISGATPGPPTWTLNGASFILGADGDTPSGCMAYTYGNLTYNGVGCSCNMHISFTGTGTVDRDSHLLAVIEQDSNTIAQISIANLAGLAGDVPPGTYDIPFTVADTVGSDSILTIFLSWAADGAGAGFPAQLSCLGVIANL